MAKILGIDLGTTNSEVAILEGGKPVVIPSAEGNRYFPSVVAFTKEGERLVGDAAKRQAVTNPEKTIREIKRKMGTDHKVSIDGKSFTPQEISAMVLQKIKQDAESYLGEKVSKAVITCPAYFNDNQRTATKDAGKIAGLEVLRIINEPTAAALAYGLDKKGEKILAVLDFGGGTFDVTIMQMGEGVFEVLSTSGDTQLGGSDMDRIVMEHILKEFRKAHGMDLKNDKQAMQRIRDAAENAKMELTSTLQTNINLPFLTADASGPKHFEMTLTRAKLEDLIAPILEKLDHPMKQALGDAKKEPKDINHVILVGGPTRMPIVRDRFKEYFGKEPERGVDPMECVAIGAAIQAGVLAGEVKDILLLDVTPLSLGVETLGAVFTPLIPRNTTIPTKKAETFSTAADNQAVVEIHVLQGERPMAKDNTHLGVFQLVGIPPAPRGIPRIEVTFDIDSNGIINVSAKDLGTGKEQRITITASTKLADADIKRMVKEADEHKDEDEKRKQAVVVKNEAESLVYTAEKTLAEFESKISAEDKTKVQDAMKGTREALGKDDLEAIQKATGKLEKALHGLSATIYQQAGVSPGAAGVDGGSKEEAAAPGSDGPEEQRDPDRGKGPKKGKKGKGRSKDEAATDTGKVVDADYKEVVED